LLLCSFNNLLCLFRSPPGPVFFPKTRVQKPHPHATHRKTHMRTHTRTQETEFVFFFHFLFSFPGTVARNPPPGSPTRPVPFPPVEEDPALSSGPFQHSSPIKLRVYTFLHLKPGTNQATNTVSFCDQKDLQIFFVPMLCCKMCPGCITKCGKMCPDCMVLCFLILMACTLCNANLLSFCALI
jgi:hypothetical protein